MQSEIRNMAERKRKSEESNRREKYKKARLEYEKIVNSVAKDNPKETNVRNSERQNLPR